jgi:hypothetical protein
MLASGCSWWFGFSAVAMNGRNKAPYGISGNEKNAALCDPMADPRVFRTGTGGMLRF